MRKKAEKTSASTSDETALCEAAQQQTDTKRRKTRAMAVLGEYMRYFGGVNSLYRNIVQRQGEVLTKHGRNGWRTLSHTDQDRAFDNHIVSKFVAHENWSTELADRTNPNESRSGGSKTRQKAHRDSLQSYTEFEYIDSFSGKFTWKSKSLQDLKFPPTPDMNESRQLGNVNGRTSKELRDLIQLNGSEGSDASESEEEVTQYVTLDQLKKELRRNYEEQQAARLKMREMEAEKHPGSPRIPEKITKTAVLERIGLGNAGHQTAKKPELKRMTISAADLKSASSLKPVNREKLKSHVDKPQENGASSVSPSLPETKPRPKSHHRTEPMSFKQSPQKPAFQDFDEILLAAEESHRKRTQSSGSKIGVSLRHDSIASNDKSSRSGSISINSGSPDKKSVKEISEDWNQYFSQKSHVQSPSNDGNSDIMDLFKDW